MLGGCKLARNPQPDYDHVVAEIKHGNLNVALGDANRLSEKYSGISPEWDWRFRILRAQIHVSQSEPQVALALLNSNLPPSLGSTDVALRKILFEGIAYRYLQQPKQAEQKLGEAEQLATSLHSRSLCQVLIAQAGLDIDLENYAAAQQYYSRARALASQYGLQDQEANIQTGLALISTRQDHLDEAVDRNQKALALARSQGMEGVEATILGNLGWAYFILGDYENALQFYKQGAETSQRLGLKGYSLYWYTGVATSYFTLHRYADAEELAQRTLEQARNMSDPETLRACLNTLAEVNLRTGKLDVAERYNQEALRMEEKGGGSIRRSPIDPFFRSHRDGEAQLPASRKIVAPAQPGSKPRNRCPLATPRSIGGAQRPRKQAGARRAGISPVYRYD